MAQYVPGGKYEMMGNSCNILRSQTNTGRGCTPLNPSDDGIFEVRGVVGVSSRQIGQEQEKRNTFR